MQLPPPRGPLSGWLISRLAGRRTDEAVVGGSDHPCTDGDLQLALWVAYELQYRGFEDAVVDGQWDPEIIAFRTRLEEPWTAWLEANGRTTPSGVPVAEQLRALIDADDGPKLSAYLRRHATVD
ncbi:hypothetical protein [Kribbella antibiotica]|uniref:hypothetical protein n=1 Tax=Kribbella antibiotica TaxID=190195 RepID=UPI00192DFFCA|nr:hypothetical protein [Kribbella antibiotica]